MERRRFLNGAALGGAALGATTGLAAPAIVHAQPTMTWRLVTPWPRNTPGVGTNAQRFCDNVTAMSDGRLTVQLFAGGELVPPFECLDAVQQGVAEMAHATPYYWAGKAPALQYFTTIPFGLSASELAAWLYFGDGMALWREVYADFGVTPFYAGSSGVQAGGWFRKEITSLADLKGLKFRIAGLGADVMSRLGVTAVTLPPGEIQPALSAGTIDGAEWIGPWNDRAFGLYQVAKYYYVPAFHEPGPGLEVIVNTSKFDALPADLQRIVDVAAKAAAAETLADFTYHNIEAYPELTAENGVQVRRFSDDIVEALGAATQDVLTALAARDAMTAKVHAAFTAFLDKANAYAKDFDMPMLEQRARALA